MTVEFKSAVASDNVNAAFMSRKDDTSTVGKIDLLNVGSATIIDLQAVLNVALDDIIDNAADIATNAGDILTNAGNISTNTGNISTNTGNISTNTGNISTNTGDISNNTGNISTNTSDISDLQDEFDLVTGHDHDGVNSKKVLATNLNTTGGTVNQVLKADGSGGGSWQDESGGGGAPNLVVTTVAINYTVLTSDDVILVNAAGAITVTLFTAVGNSGKIIRVKKIINNNNEVIVDGDGAETIDGQASYQLDIQYEEITLVSDGANWQILNIDIPPVGVNAFGNSGGSVTANTTNLLFATETFDPLGNWSGTSYTAPKEGLYNILGIAFFTAAAAWGIELYVDGVWTRRIGENYSDSRAPFAGGYYAAKGEVLTLRTGVGGTQSNNSRYHHISISRAN